MNVYIRRETPKAVPKLEHVTIQSYAMLTLFNKDIISFQVGLYNFVVPK